MRIKINLSSRPSISIPIDYNYNIYLGLRKILLDFLSSNKPKLFNKYKKTFPEFTFSQLMIPDRKIELGFIEITGRYLSFYLSSIDDTFIEFLSKAVTHCGEISIHNKKFKLTKIEFQEEPEFSERMKFRMLSPLLLAKPAGGKPVFVRPGDSDLDKIFSSRLVEKYNTLYRTAYTNKQLKIELDQDYLERKKNLTRLLTIRNINYKTIFAPFYLNGETDLIKFAYHNGIGDKTHYGLGMIELIAHGS
ncbi:MAG: CRISPR-associated endoribonuclease Cas6 [bacterium]|nr:CRISPR-associated endoribonuclease Cas6 [bacterium]